MAGFQTLRHRSSFLKVKKCGDFLKSHDFFVQVLPTTSFSEELDFCFGVTASKKVGKSVQRNFSKRRMRSLFREYLTKNKAYFPKGYVYNIVLIAKKSLLTTPYETLKKDLECCLKSWLKSKDHLL